MITVQELHARKGRKITTLAWALEAVVVSTALALSAMILFSGAAEDVNQAAKIIALMPLIGAAAIEFGKIPLASAVIFSRWYMKPIAVVLLLGVSFSTFETLFQGFEHGANIRISKVTRAQNELTALSDQRDRLRDKTQKQEDTTSLELARITEQIKILNDQNDQYRREIEIMVTGANDPRAVALTKTLEAAKAEVDAIKQERIDAEAAAGNAWQATSDQYRARIAAGGTDGKYAEGLQRKMPAKSQAMTEAGNGWDRENVERLKSALTEMDQTNSELKDHLRGSGNLDQSRVFEVQKNIDINNNRIADLSTRASGLSFIPTGEDSTAEIATLDGSILTASTNVDLFSGASNVYRFAGLLFSKPVVEVSAPEARKAAALFWGALSAVLALATAGLAMVGAHHTSLSMDKRTPNERRLVKSKWSRKKTVEVVREVLTTKYVWYPTAEAVQATPKTLRAIPTPTDLNPFSEERRDAAK